MGQPVDMPDVLAQARKMTERGPGEKMLKPSDYDIRVGQLTDKAKMIATLKSRLKAASEAREPFEKDWRSAFLAWMQILDTDKEASWESERYLPMVLQHVETALPNITSAVFNRRRVFRCDGQDPQSRNAAEATEMVLDYQIRAQCGMEPAFDRALWFSTLFGTGYLDTGWSYKQETSMQPTVVVDTDEDGEIVMNTNGFPRRVKIMREQTSVTEDFPVVRAPHPMDIWAAPYSEAGDDCDWFFEYRTTTVGRLRNAAGQGHIDAKALEQWIKLRRDGTLLTETESSGLWEGANTRLWDQWMRQAGYQGRPENITDDWHVNDQEVVLCCYRSKTENITLVEGDWIIGYSETPYLHGKTGLVCHQFFPLPGSPYGRGLGTILLGHQELVNENINRYMDAAALSLMAPIIVNRSSISVLDKEFVWEPNALIHARDVNNGAKRMEMPAPTNLALQIDAHLKKDADDTSGFGEQMRGQASPGVGTATEFKGIQQNIQNRAYMHVRRLQQTMSMVGTLLMKLNLQFMTQDAMVKVVGQKGVDYAQIEPWALVGNCRVTCTADPNRASPEVDAQQLIGAIQVTVPLLTGQAGPAGPKLARMLFESIGVEDVNDLVPDVPGSPRDPMIENVALEQGIAIEPHPGEDFTAHMQVHSQRLKELEVDGGTPGIIGAFREHIEKTAAAAAEAGQAQMGGGPGGGADVQNAQPDATQGTQPGQIEGQAQGAGGIPGQAAPGPQFAPGRML